MPPSRYRKRKINGKTFSEHRLVWERHHGEIPPGHLIHHRDGDRFNNTIENLELMTHEQHSRHHNDKHPRVKVCDVCGIEYEPAPTKRERSRTCSRACMRTLLSHLAREREAKRRVPGAIPAIAAHELKEAA